MHPNPAFRQSARDVDLAFARERGFGILCLNGAEGPLIAHVPFLLDEAGTRAELHLVRSNPIARVAASPVTAALAVTGPDGYVSPDWYGQDDQVPTWNYVAVHLRGRLEPADPAGLRDHLDRISDAFERRLEKAPWTTGKMTPEVLQRMMRTILPFTLRVEEVLGTWKLNQNKTDAARAGAAAAMARSVVGQETAALSRLMARGAEPEMDKT
jgi:transcriptional regulator